MERVLALYAEPDDPSRPVVCFDERPCVLHDDVRDPLPMLPGLERKQGHEDTRGGTCCALAAFEPLSAWRRTWALLQRRRVDFAACVRELCDERYPEAKTARLVCDQLNTHSAASFYEAFAPEEARRLAAKVEFVHTPVHGSWLNAVEVELSVFVRQCLGRRRIGSVEGLRAEAEAWAARRNAEGGTVEWQMTTEPGSRSQDSTRQQRLDAALDPVRNLGAEKPPDAGELDHRQERRGRFVELRRERPVLLEPADEPLGRVPAPVLVPLEDRQAAPATALSARPELPRPGPCWATPKRTAYAGSRRPDKVTGRPRTTRRSR